jgi:hypothetical protein
LFAFLVKLGEPGADADAEDGGGGVGAVGGEFFELDDLGVLRSVDPVDAGLDGGGLGIALGGGLGVDSRHLRQDRHAGW